MEQYSLEEFDSYVKVMKKASDILRSKSPNYIFAPILGSVPFIDVLSIIDRHFPISNVEYPPNSSRFSNRGELIDNWYSNFIKDNYTGKKMSIVCIDEIISGSSAVKGYNEFQKVLYNFRKDDSKIEKKINYEILGIGEKPRNGSRNPNFNRLINKKKAKVLETKRIITADNPLLNPIKLKVGGINNQGRQTYLPEIESFNYSPEYILFLQNTANYFGVDPDSICLPNLSKIKDSSTKYLK